MPANNPDLTRATLGVIDYETLSTAPDAHPFAFGYVLFTYSDIIKPIDIGPDMNYWITLPYIHKRVYGRLPVDFEASLIDNRMRDTIMNFWFDPDKVGATEVMQNLKFYPELSLDSFFGELASGCADYATAHFFGHGKDADIIWTRELYRKYTKQVSNPYVLSYAFNYQQSMDTRTLYEIARLANDSFDTYEIKDAILANPDHPDLINILGGHACIKHTPFVDAVLEAICINTAINQIITVRNF